MDEMVVSTAFKTRLHLNNRQRSEFSRWSAARRFAFNYALNLCFMYLEDCERKGKENLLLNKISEFDKYFNASKYPLKFARKQKGGAMIGTGGNEWVREVGIPSSACQIAIKYNLKDAWKRCFKGLGRQPKYQSRRRKDSFTLSSADMKSSAISRDYVELPKGLGKAKLGDPIPYSVYKTGNVSFMRSGDKWYVSFVLKVPASEYYRNSGVKKEAVGVDLGVKIYAATSDGINFYSPEKLICLEKRKGYINKKIGQTIHKNLMLVVKNCQRCSELVTGIHMKKRLCMNCRDVFLPLLQSRKLVKLRASVSRIASKQQHIRENMGHQLTTELVRKYNHIVLEDLQLKNMTASAKGDAENPGKKVRQKAGLNRSMLNVAPYRVRSMLEYKTDKYGCVLNVVDPRYTSLTCSKCGHADAGNRQTQAQFVCQRCGYAHNADTNAAINILNKLTELAT